MRALILIYLVNFGLFSYNSLAEVTPPGPYFCTQAEIYFKKADEMRTEGRILMAHRYEARARFYLEKAEKNKFNCEVGP